MPPKRKLSQEEEPSAKRFQPQLSPKVEIDDLDLTESAAAGVDNKSPRHLNQPKEIPSFPNIITPAPDRIIPFLATAAAVDSLSELSIVSAASAFQLSPKQKESERHKP